ncbi:MAG: hypothetical protein AB8I08_37380 [Sandaracinaceae bacterium]
MNCRLLPLLAALLTGCFSPVPSDSGALCDNTCRYANDGDCDDGGDGADFDLCATGTDCGDCGPRGDTGGGPVPGPTMVDHGLPADALPLSERYRSHARWRDDDSGFDALPNRQYASVEELPVLSGVQTFGALWNGAAYELEFEDASAGEVLVIELRALDVGVYDVTGFDGRLQITEHRGGSYRYVTDIAGGSGTVEILGRSETALWGRFEARVCFTQTPNVNCSARYDGRFTATLP